MGSLNINMPYKDNIGIPIIKIRQSHDCLILIMGIPIPGKMVFLLKQIQVIQFNPHPFPISPSVHQPIVRIQAPEAVGVRGWQWPVICRAESPWLALFAGIVLSGCEQKLAIGFVSWPPLGPAARCLISPAAPAVDTRHTPWRRTQCYNNTWWLHHGQEPNTEMAFQEANIIAVKFCRGCIFSSNITSRNCMLTLNML